MKLVLRNVSLPSGVTSAMGSDQVSAGSNVFIVDDQTMIESMASNNVRIDLQKDGDGYTAVVPIEAYYGAQATDNIRVMSKVSFSASASRSANGTRRILLRASMLYFSLDPDKFATGVKTVSPSRSGKTITAHLVLTLPKEAEQDARGMTSGTPGVTLCEAQIGGLLDLLRGLIGNAGCGFLDNGSELATINGDLHLDPANVAPKSRIAGSDQIAGYGSQPGIVMKPSAPFSSDSSNPIQRVILGLAPLSDDAVVTLGLSEPITVPDLEPGE